MKNCFKLFRLVKIKSDKYCQERRFLWEDWEILKWNFLCFLVGMSTGIPIVENNHTILKTKHVHYNLQLPLLDLFIP